jgi:endonuclease YncB( thermonuclease family)
MRQLIGTSTIHTNAAAAVWWAIFLLHFSQINSLQLFTTNYDSLGGVANQVSETVVWQKCKTLQMNSFQSYSGASVLPEQIHPVNPPSRLRKYLSLYLLDTAVDDDKSNGIYNENGNTNNIYWNLHSSAVARKESDEVVRIIDANTVKLQRNGLVTFAAVQTPSGYNDSNFRFPDCMAKSPSSKIRQLLPPKTKVDVVFTDTNYAAGDTSNRPRPVLMEATRNDKKHFLVNTELVREGFAKPSSKGGRSSIEAILPGYNQELLQLQSEAREKGLGMFKSCDNSEDVIAADDQFEPLDLTTEIRWGDDGGSVVLKEKSKGNDNIPPSNPGDRRGCSDFSAFEDALRYYEFYYPFYGDVAKLDRDGDGIPCSGLPHTQNSAKYRIKKPSTVASVVVDVE